MEQSINIFFSDIILSNWSIISFTNHICVWSLSFWAIIYTIFCAIPISKEFPSIWQESSPNNYVTHWTNFRNRNFPVSYSGHTFGRFLNLKIKILFSHSLWFETGKYFADQSKAKWNQAHWFWIVLSTWRKNIFIPSGTFSDE